MADNKKTKVIRDPIHDLILFENNECDRLLLDLINTEEFQRLRRIKQLGFSDMVFPGANHTRFAHSIGVMAMARRFLDALRREYGDSEITRETKILVLVTCLLHDLGHGPFSHTFEGITKDKHEERTKEIIMNGETGINHVLSSFDSRLPEAVKDYINHVTPKWPAKTVFSHIVSSQLDADRFDFLLRDSHATGALYGQFDPAWIVEHLRIDQDNDLIYLDHKGVEAAEMYVYARYHMYLAVYFHKTTRAAEVMLKSLFERFKKLLAENTDASAVVPDAPKHIIRAFSSGMKLKEYLLLDDFTVWEFLKACRYSSDDKIIRDIAEGLLTRRLWKAVDKTYDDTKGKQWHAKLGAAEAFLKKKNFDPEYYLQEDAITSTPYKPYIAGKEPEERGIYCQQTSTTPPAEISTFSKPIQALTPTVGRLRYYFPESCIEEIRKTF